MEKPKVAGWILRTLFLLFLVALVTAMLFTAPVPAQADTRLEARHLVEKAQLTLENFMSAREMQAFRNLLGRARGVYIAPQVLRGAFVVGAAGGSGILLARDLASNQWTGPAFYTMGEVSFGFQAGGEASEVVLLIMTSRGVNSLLSTSVKLGADITLAVGPVGMGAEASTANLSVDILSFARSKGLYGGISLEGAVMATREGWNSAYYGRWVTPTDILFTGLVKNAHATPLLESLDKAAGNR
jgi:SH3 domain-containing YSC84-like protein 1